MRHQYGISALVSQMPFRGETVSNVAKYRLFSQARKMPIAHSLFHQSKIKTILHDQN